MSPVSSRKVNDLGARVQAPFTLSDTRTRSGALYWANHPTSRSPWATGPLSVTVTDETRAVENAAPWTKLGEADWATAGRGSRAARVAITAIAAVDRAEGKCFTVIPCGADEAQGHPARIHPHIASPRGAHSPPSPLPLELPLTPGGMREALVGAVAGVRRPASLPVAHEALRASRSF